MSAHLHLPLHLPRPHIAAEFAGHVFGGIFEAFVHHHSPPAPPRAVPAAADWNDWHYEADDGKPFPGRSSER